ncbi:MAG: penicillin-binding protein 2, partial [Candidatus Omnitrophica bacterium]|nr:penicillin-binding protein 2 [Candidatus Omnitrophota bacterium]
FDCIVIPQEFEPDRKAFEEVSRLLNTPVSALKDKRAKDAIAPFVAVAIKKDIGKETAIAISEKSPDLPGLLIQTRSVRYYPYKNVGAHVVGYLGKISEEELYTLSDYGYKNMDYVGRGGLELYYDSYLKGEEGGIQTEVDSRGMELKQLGIKEPEKGKDIQTTIDLELEKYVDSLLEGHRGAAIVMNSATGEILTLVSKPDFDPNAFVSATDPSFISSLLERSDCPMIDRAVSGAYPPGSVFKIVTSSAGLDSKKISPSERLNCPGYYMLGNRRFNCWKETGHGAEVITEGIRNSCNVFFYQVGRKVGPDLLASYAFRYGFGRNSQVDLPYETTGTVPTRRWKMYRIRQGWYEGDTVNYSIGQGYVLVTPLQILRMVNGIATEGSLVRPYIVKSIDSLEVGGQQKKRIDVSKETLKIIKEGMRRAVEDPNGTAKAAAVKELSIFGKTGTAQAGPKGTHAWFTGFCLGEKAKFSVVVFLEYGGKGGDKPAKIASGIFAKLKELNYL